MADGVDFPSHRAVLAACSPYFYAMFTNDVAEARTPSITLQNIDTKAMQLLMDFIYTSEIRVTEDNVQVCFNGGLILSYTSTVQRNHFLLFLLFLLSSY